MKTKIKTKNRFLAMLLTLCMVLSMTAVTAFAQSDPAEAAPAAESGVSAAAAGEVEINEQNFPDGTFRKYVAAQFDKDKDSKLSEQELAQVTEIEVEEKGISSLKGIEFFTALTYLDCYTNNLTSLDVSKNTALTDLDCSDNNLTELDVSRNTALTSFDCYTNNLTSLDVSKNTALTSLYCDENSLTSLDVSKNTALTSLGCSSNNLTKLDVSKNTALTGLACSSNGLTSLDVSNNPALEELYCDDTNLTSLDVSKNTALTRLDCSTNDLTSLDVSKNTALTDLDCSDNNLTKLDVSKNTALDDLYCDENSLTSLDVSKNTALEDLDCGSNNLTSLDVSNNPALIYLDCTYNNLTSLDVSKNAELRFLNCESNHLTNLDLRQNRNPFLILVSLKGQTITAPATQVDGQWQIDMAKVVGASNLENVTLDGSSYSYDSKTGIVTLGETLPQNFKYNYNAGKMIDGSPLTMDVTVTPSSQQTEPTPAPDYQITEGANSSWTKNSNGTLTFKANGDLDKLDDVRVDGQTVPKDKYTAVAGSTIITLKSEYLDTLSVGAHTITVVYSDGEASANFEIKAASAASSDFDLPVNILPRTGGNYTLVDGITGKVHLENGVTGIPGNPQNGQGILIDEYYPSHPSSDFEKEYYGTLSSGYDFLTEFGIYMPMTTMKDADGNDLTTGIKASVTIPVPEGYTGEGVIARKPSGAGAIEDIVVNSDNTVTISGIDLQYTGSYLMGDSVIVEWKKAAASTNPGGETTPGGSTTPGGNTNQGGNTNPGTTTSPQTGDNSNLALWFALLLLSGCGVIATTVISRKRKYNR